MAHSSTTNEWATGLLPHVTTSVKSGCGPPVIRWIASFARMQSIRQSVQNGQFLLSPASTRRNLRYCPKCFPAASRCRSMVLALAERISILRDPSVTGLPA